LGLVCWEGMATGMGGMGGNGDGSVDALCEGALGPLVEPEDGEELASAICVALAGGAPAGDRTGRFKPRLFTEHIDALQSLLCAHEGGSRTSAPVGAKGSGAARLPQAGVWTRAALRPPPRWRHGRGDVVAG